MTDNNGRDIEPPKTHAKRDALRAMLEAALSGAADHFGASGAGGVVTAGLRAALPSRTEQDRDRWTSQMTERVNEHDRELLADTVQVAGTALALAEWLAVRSENGFDEPYAETADIAASLGNGHPAEDVLAAAEELAALGLVGLLLNPEGGGLVWPKPPLFAALDPVVMGWDTEEDARCLAGLVLEGRGGGEEGGFSTPALHEASGLDRRRFNPALCRMTTLFEPGHLGREPNPLYPITWGIVSGATRAGLCRFTSGQRA